MSEGRGLSLVLLGGGALSLGLLALALLPGLAGGWTLRAAVGVLLATPWTGIAWLGAEALASGRRRRALLALALLSLAALSLLAG